MTDTMTYSDENNIDWDKWEKDSCTGCSIRRKPIHYMKECPVHGHGAAWKNVEAAYGLHWEEDCKGCTINPNDIVFFADDCPVHHSLSDGISMADIQKAGGRNAYLREMDKLEDNPETFLCMRKEDGAPVLTSNTANVLYYLRRYLYTVRMLSIREAELVRRCTNSRQSDCPYDDPEVGECPMHPQEINENEQV